MKSAFLPMLLALVIALIANVPSALAQQVSSTSISVVESNARTFAALGTISNVQFEDGNPAWILSGGWKIRASITSDDEAVMSLTGATMMVRTDGTAMHRHEFSEFTLQSWSIDNNTATFSGLATISLRDGPQQGVPVIVTIKNGGALTLAIDTAVVDHFGSDPIYGLVLRQFDSSPGVMTQGGVEASPTDTYLEDLQISSVNYYPNATGFLAYPVNKTALPAVVMIHEWWGLNENIKNEAEKLASEGYAVLAVDLYNGQIAADANTARTLASEVGNNVGPSIENLRAAVTYLSSMPNVNASRIASLGWCFGGGYSLQLALNTETPLAATVIYYGTLVTDPQELSNIEWPVLGIFGSIDQSIPVETVREFEAALDTNGTPNDIHIYEGVGHAFANPSGDNYAQNEAADAWSKTLAFLREHV